MQQLITTSNANSVVTMSSLEMVDFINAQRGDEQTKLRHDSFLAKVPKVLGEDAQKFLGIYMDSMNRQKPCYNFPKREACLMAMSYSYELQAKVFDRMTELENKPQIPTVKNPALQMVIALAAETDRIEQEQKRQAAEVASLQETVAVLEARTQPENKHFTVLGYANLIGQKIDHSTASLLGRKCANLSREQGLVIGDVTDPRFGRVHSYHESVLKAVVGERRAA